MSKDENQDEHQSAVICAKMKIKPPVKCCTEVMGAAILALFLILGQNIQSDTITLAVVLSQICFMRLRKFFPTSNLLRVLLS